MGTKGPKAGNIYSSLKSRGLIGGKGKDPMLNCGSPFKQTEGQRKTFGPNGKAPNPEIYSAIVKEDKREGEVKLNATPFKQTKDGSDASLYGKAKAAVVGAVDAAGGVKGMAKNMAKSINMQITSLGQGNRHMDGPAPTPPVKDSPKPKNAPSKYSSNPRTSFGGPKKKGCKY